MWTAVWVTIWWFCADFWKPFCRLMALKKGLNKKWSRSRITSPGFESFSQKNQGGGRTGEAAARLVGPPTPSLECCLLKESLRFICTILNTFTQFPFHDRIKHSTFRHPAETTTRGHEPGLGHGDSHMLSSHGTPDLQLLSSVCCDSRLRVSFNLYPWHSGQ